MNLTFYPVLVMLKDLWHMNVKYVEAGCKFFKSNIMQVKGSIIQFLFSYTTQKEYHIYKCCLLILTGVVT